jgi:hypothetical protein
MSPLIYEVSPDKFRRERGSLEPMVGKGLKSGGKALAIKEVVPVLYHPLPFVACLTCSVLFVLDTLAKRFRLERGESV